MEPPQFTVTYPGYCIDSHWPRFFWPLMKLRGAPLWTKHPLPTVERVKNPQNLSVRWNPSATFVGYESPMNTIPLKNMKVSWDYYSQYNNIWKNKNCSKPPTSYSCIPHQPKCQASYVHQLSSNAGAASPCRNKKRGFLSHEGSPVITRGFNMSQWCLLLHDLGIPPLSKTETAKYHHPKIYPLVN